jgi:general secretion pathway protein B
MSYILDALRRADAERERERGGVPGLHTVPVGAAAAAAVPARKAWLPIALALAVLTAALLAGWWWWPTGPAAQPRGGPAAPAPPPIVLSSPPPLPAAPSSPAPAEVVATPAPAPVVAAPPAQRLVQPAAAQSEPAAIRPPSAPRAATVPALADKAGVAPAIPAAAGSAAAGRAEDRVLAFEQLPDDVRRALPPLAIGGAVYSDNPGSRLLMIGGQLLKEGDNAGAGVTLEEIRPRSAVLRWKDVRYEVRY